MKKLTLLLSVWMYCLISTAQSYSINVDKALVEFNYVSEETTGKIKGVSGESNLIPIIYLILNLREKLIFPASTHPII